MILLTGADPAGLNLNSARLQLKKRADLLAKIREYFTSAQVLEVTTPLLCRYASSDPQINSFCVENPESLSVGCGQDMAGSQPLYLQTSPESGMKQLLSMNSGSIFQLGKAFRRDQPGRLNLLPALHHTSSETASNRSLVHSIKSSIRPAKESLAPKAAGWSRSIVGSDKYRQALSGRCYPCSL